MFKRLFLCIIFCIKQSVVKKSQHHYNRMIFQTLKLVQGTHCKYQTSKY